MNRLQIRLEQLQAKLPSPQEITDINDLETIIDAAGAEILLHEFPVEIDHPDFNQLTPHQKKLFQALSYIKTFWPITSAIAFDGFFSIFYNSTGAELHSLRAKLRMLDTHFFGLFEVAYTAVAKDMNIPESCNIVSTHPNSWTDDEVDGEVDGPWSLLSKESLEVLDRIEAEIEQDWDQIFEKAMALYSEAFD